MQTKEVIKSMLVENTGSHMLDSGGAYGRNHERNQSRDFDNEPTATLSAKHGYLDVSKNIYHFLVEHLEFHPALDDKFQAFCDSNDDHDFSNMNEFPTNLKKHETEDYDISSPWDSRDDSICVNTYNHDSALSQVIQYVAFHCNHELIVILQVHGGCDVRGGYTKPRVFLADESFFNDQSITISPVIPDDHRDRQLELFPAYTTSDVNWYSDDTCHFYFDGGSQGTQLHEYEFVHEKDLDTESGATKEDYINQAGNGIIFVDDSGVPHCPVTGYPLQAY